MSAVARKIRVVFADCAALVSLDHNRLARRVGLADLLAVMKQRVQGHRRYMGGLAVPSKKLTRNPFSEKFPISG